MKKFKYIEIAEKIEQLIFSNTFKSGDKLQSVRALSKDYGISVSTSFKVYYYLESKGLIEAKPKSGYYIKPRLQNRFKEVDVELDRVCEISTLSELTTQIIEAVPKEENQLSVLIPPIDLLPIAKLKKSAQKVLQSSPTACTEYGSIKGSEEAREETAKHILNSHTLVKPKDLLLTNGCYEAIYLALKATTNPGDIVAVESPTVFGILQLINSLKLKILELPTHPGTGICTHQLEKNIKTLPIKACIFIPNFSNPTGSLMFDEKKQKVVEMLEKAEIPLIEDDLYGDIYFGASRPRTCKSFDKSGNVILCSSLSKTLAPGYRFGWIAPGKYYKAVYKIKMEQSIYGSTLNQKIITHFLKNGRFDLHLRNYRNKMYERYQKTLKLIDMYFPKNIKITQPKGGMALWIELASGFDATQLSLSLLKENIGLLPGKAFTTTDYYNNYIRLGFSNPLTSELERKIARIGEKLQE